jgi:hypothetical protein
MRKAGQTDTDMTKLIGTYGNVVKSADKPPYVLRFARPKRKPEASDQEERPPGTRPQPSIWIQVPQLRKYTLELHTRRRIVSIADDLFKFWVFSVP